MVTNVVSSKLREGLAAGYASGWRLDETDRQPVLRPETVNDKNVGVFLRSLSGGRVEASAHFPTFQGHDCGRRLLETARITLALDRSLRAFMGDLDRRLLRPFLAALPEARAERARLQAAADEQVALYAGLKQRMPPGGWASDREFTARGTYHRLDSSAVKVTVRRANPDRQGGYPASVDIELSGLPPAIAAAVLDLLGEEATN